MMIAIVIDSINDQRVALLAKLFGNQEHHTVVVYERGENWALCNAEGKVGQRLGAGNIPTSVGCVFVHGSDSSSWEKAKTKLGGGFGKLFVFDSSGNPPGMEKGICILRSTNPFSLTEKDAAEICKYATDTSGTAPLPSCCRRAAKHLIALDILCQGYLVAHGLLGGSLEVASASNERPPFKPTAKPSEWWLRGLQVSSFEELNDVLTVENVPKANAEEVVGNLRKAPNVNQKEEHLVVKLRELIANLLS